MKRRCYLILAALLMFCSAAGAETPQLIPASPVTLPAEAAGMEQSPKAFLGLSPDGKTLLTFTSEEVPLTEDEIAAATEKAQEKSSQVTVNRSFPRPGRAKESAYVPSVKTVYHFCLVRDGEVIPVEDNLEFGSGDPNQHLENFKEMLQGFPGLNGLSWSEDGRYVTFSDMTKAVSQLSKCVPVIDTVSKEAWLAESYGSNLFEEDFGIMYLSAMSRDGRYVYYISLKHDDESSFLCFCRCATADGSSEILCRTPSVFQADSASNLVETADGSWLLSGIHGTGSRKTDGIAMVRFAPAGNEWKADILQTGISGLLSSARFVYTPATGYGLMIAYNKNAVQVSEQVTTDGAFQNMLPAGFAKRVNLIRFHPGQDMQFDVWYMQRTGETVDDMKMVSGAEYLAYLLAVSSGTPIVPPDGYSPEEELRNPGPMIYNICWSPDGRYALLAVKTNLDPGSDSMELYLLDPETMEIRHVESPADVIDIKAGAGVMLGFAYRPGIVWNPDGTVVLLTKSGTIGFFRLTGY